MPRALPGLCRVALGLILGGFAANVAHAQDVAHAQAAASAVLGREPATPLEPPDPSISQVVPALAQIKQPLLAHGVNLQFSYLQDTFGNIAGGVRQGATYSSALYMLLDVDLGKLAGLSGLTFRANAYQIPGAGLSVENIYNYAAISSIEARSTTRLVELWLEQKFLNDLASIRVGQLAADTEFFTSEFDALYVNGTFGWATIFAANLPGGGPGYPLATPGARLKLTPNEHVTLLAGIFNGDPAGTGFSGQEQIADPAGINFRLHDPALLFGEAQYAYHQDKTSSGLAGTVKLGAWVHFGSFTDKHFGFDGKSLADPTGVGIPLAYAGDYSVYGVIDQMIWRLPGDHPKKGVAVFGRIAASPSDRNLMDFYADAGVNFIGILTHRPDDTFGLAASYSRLSPSVAALDRDNAFFNGELSPKRDYELALELTYQASVVPGWTVQPDLQYIVHPGGGAPDPANPAQRIPNAAVIGLRTVATF